MVEIGLRRATGPLRFEATAYYTRFDNFIFRRLTGVMCDGTFDSCGAPDAELKQRCIRSGTRSSAAANSEPARYLTILRGCMGHRESIRYRSRHLYRWHQTFRGFRRCASAVGLFWRDANWLMRVNLLHAFAQNDIALIGETPTRAIIC